MLFYRIRKLAIVLIMIAVAGCGRNSVPSDEDLIATFHYRRAEFDRLLQMIIADTKLYRIDCDWTDPKEPIEAGVSPERIAEYRRLLDDVGCHRGFEAFQRQGIHFIAAARGLVTGGSSKGLYYFAGAPPLVVTNTATYSQKPQEYSYEVFRHIEGHWYVFFESD